MKTTERIAIYAALLVSIVMWHRSCSSNRPIKTKTITIDIPKQLGNFKQSKPVHVNVDSIAQLVRDTIPERVRIIKEAEKSNDSLLNAYRELETEFDRFKLFQRFVSTKEFNQDFEDDFLKLKISGIARGKVESIGIDYYEIKERQKQAEYTIPRQKRWAIGIYFGYDVIELQPSIGISLTYGIIML